MQRYAFFDLDGTLINDTSLLSCCAHHLRQQGKSFQASRDELAALRAAGLPREQQNAWFYQQHFAGFSVVAAQAAASAWFAEARQQPGFYKTAAVARLRELQQQGVEIVLVTGSFAEAARSVGSGLGVQHYLCAPLLTQDGVYTGALSDIPMIGVGKAQAVQRFLAQHAAHAADAYGFGDDHSDLPFLQLLGQPTAVAGHCPLLVQHARAQGWPVLAAEALNDLVSG